MRQRGVLAPDRAVRPGDRLAGTARTQSARFNRVPGAVLLLILMAGLGGNLWFGFTASGTGNRPLSTTLSMRAAHLIGAVALDRNRVLTATVDDHVTLSVDGRARHSIKLGSVVGAVAADPRIRRVYIGTSAGQISSYTPALAKLPEKVSVNGQVVGLTPGPEAGSLVAAYGYGAYGNNYYVAKYLPNKRKPAFTTRAKFTITALSAGSTGIFYGTLRSNVVALNPRDGTVAWTYTAPGPVKVITQTTGRGAVLVGTDTGDLDLLDHAGTRLAFASPTPYPITSILQPSGTDSYVVGDKHGSVFVLDHDLHTVRDAHVADDAIVALLADGHGRVRAVPSDGAWSGIDLTAASGARMAAQLRRDWAIFDGIVGIAIVLTLVGTVKRWWIATLRTLRAMWRGHLGYVLTLPALLVVLMFSYYPAVSAVIYSFTDFSLNQSVVQNIGLANYRDIIVSDAYFHKGLVNMAIIVGTTLLKTLTVPLIAAELVFWIRNHVHQYIFRTLFILPTVVPGLVLTLLWRQVYDPNSGLLNEILGGLGFPHPQTAWLGDPRTALWAVVGVGLPYINAFSFLIFLGGLLGISSDYFDAAKVDGAGVWRRLRHIDLPLLGPQFRIMVFFAVTGAVEGFASIFVLTGGGPGDATYVPALEMYLRISNGRLGYASALGVILFVLVLAATLVILRVHRRGETAD